MFLKWARGNGFLFSEKEYRGNQNYRARIKEENLCESAPLCKAIFS